MKILFAGAEVGSNRTLLESMGVEWATINFYHLKKRGLPKNKIWLISEHFLPEMSVVIEPGVAQAEKDGLSKEELTSLAAEYQEFLVNNSERASAFIEFDSLILGKNWVEAQRPFFENDPKLWVVWHQEYGLADLKRLSETHRNVAIPNDEIEAVTSLAALTRSYNRTYGTLFHALGCAKPDNLRQVLFASASTLSWLSPMRRGETIVWDGSKLVRYPKRMKDQARPRYKTLVESIGLDYLSFKEDTTTEATKLAVWSYRKLEESMDKKTPDLHIIEGGNGSQLSDNSDTPLLSGLGQLEGYLSDNSGSEVSKVERTEVVQRDPNEVAPLPVFGYKLKTVVEQDEEGRDVLKEVPMVHTQSASLRQCDTCFVAANCPAFKPQNSCAFNLPVEVKTREQLKALLTAIIEMQGQRVAFMRFAEEMNGGYADPNVSKEIDRLMKLVGQVKEMESNKEFIQITAQRQSAGGVLSAIFGDRAQALKELPESLKEDQVTRIITTSIED